MLFGTVPLTFAAIDPIVPDNDTRFPVIERSSETVYIQKAIPDVSEQETIFLVLNWVTTSLKRLV